MTCPLEKRTRSRRLPTAASPGEGSRGASQPLLVLTHWPGTAAIAAAVRQPAPAPAQGELGPGHAADLKR